jgi:tetratricopeptide (TPR) repeat protein
MMTIPGTVAGTVAYMSPEQIRGEDLDCRTDIFSFGIVLYELVTGVRPFASTSAADIMAAILKSDVSPFTEDRPVPVELWSVIAKCLEKDRTKRHRSAAEVAEDLARVRRRLDGAPGTADVEAPLPPSPLLAGALAAPFVGRETELQCMTAAWDRAQAGQRAVILVAGEPGIGKTRLCAEFARRCENQGATVLIGRSDEQALAPYQPFIEAVGWYARHCPPARLYEHLSAIGGGAELALLLPDLPSRVPALPPVAPMSPEAQRFRLFETVTAFLAAVSASLPALLVFDDLQWADQPSILMLRHLIRSSTPSRLSVIVNYRESEIAGRELLGEMLADLRRESFVTRVNLAGLSETEVGELVDKMTAGAPRALVRAVAENSAGNPFFAGEMVRHLIETGAFQVLQDTIAVRKPELGVPDAVREVIRRRVSRLSSDCSQALTAAAVVGQEFDLALVQDISGIAEERLLDAVDEAVRAQLVVEAGGDRCRFVHALIRETLYETLSGPRRARMHRKTGEAMERRAGATPPLADLAYHFTAAAAVGAADKAVHFAALAGDRAQASLAHEEAARYYAMALKSLDAVESGDPAETHARRLDLHMRRAGAFRDIGCWPLAKDEFEKALAYVGDAGERRCELLLGITDASFWLGREVAEVERLANESLSLAAQLADRSDLAATAMAFQARCRIVSGDLGAAITLNQQAIRLAGPHRTAAHAFVPIAFYLAGRTKEAIEAGREAARVARSSHDSTFTLYSLPHFAISLAVGGEYIEALQVFEEARAFGRKYGAMGPLARVLSFQAGMHLGVFDYGGAENLQREAREMAASAGLAQPFISSGIDLLLTLARTKNPGPAEDLLKDTAARAGDHPWHRGLWTVRLSQAKAELALARGDFESAVLESTTAIAQSRELGRPKYEALALATLADAHRQLGRRAEAVENARDALSAARRTSDPALTVQTLGTMLALEPNDDLLGEARKLIVQVAQALPLDSMRQSFENSDTVRFITRV